MTIPEKFRTFVAECQAMAKLARAPESKIMWGAASGKMGPLRGNRRAAGVGRILLSHEKAI
jgi:hypothetical protein